MKGSRQQAALAEIEADSENARAAWNWAVERGQVERLAQAIEGLCCFYDWRGRYQEGEVACRTAAGELATSELVSEKLVETEKQSPGGRPVLSSVEGLRVWARALAWQSVFSWRLGRTESARQLL